MLDQKLLHELFEYRNGELYRKVTINNRAKANAKVGCDNGVGLLVVGYKRKLYPVHKLIFIMFHGYKPERVNHIDGNTLNNKIENLRNSTCSQSGFTRIKNTNNRSGYKGVFWSNHGKKWKAEMTVNKKRINLGYFEDKEKAHQAYIEAAKEHHKEFANLNG